MKKHIPNILTSLNLAIGSAGIYYVLTTDHTYAFYFVAVAGVFDFLDGFAARMLNVKSEIGKELDSLADVVSFGLLPSFYMMKLLDETSAFYWIALLIAVFSALRLAKFNVDDSQTDSFEGLPTPANAIMLTSLLFLENQLAEATIVGICLMSALLLISKLRLLALKFSSFGWKNNEARWILLLGSGILFLVFGWTFIPLLIPFYIVVSLLSSVIVRKA